MSKPTIAQLRARLDAQIKEQRAWMDKCGGSRSGYILRYGGADNPDRSGDGGEAIYLADAAVLAALRRRRALLDPKLPGWS